MALQSKNLDLIDLVNKYWLKFGPPPLRVFPDEIAAKKALRDAIKNGKPINIDDWLPADSVN